MNALTLLGLLLVAQTPDTSLRFSAFTPSRAIPVDGGRKLYVVGRTTPDLSWVTYILGCPELDLRSVTALGELYVFPPGATTSWRFNKVYQTGSYDLAVFDNARDSCIKRIPNLQPCMMAHHSVNGRLYVTARGVGYVIDCTTDSVVKVLNPLDSLAGVCVWDSAGNKVYMGGWGWRTGDRLNVIDCTTDSVVRSSATGVLWARHAVYYPQRRRIYLQGEEAIGHSAVIDCVNDSVIRRHQSFYGLFAPVVVPSEDKVYWHDLAGLTTDSLQVTDCRAETVLHSIEPPWPSSREWWLKGMTYAEWSNRLYVVAGARVGGVPNDWLVSIDCVTDSILGWAQLPGYGAAVEANPYDRRIYVVSYVDSAIYVYRDEVPAVAERTPPTAHGSRLKASHVRGVLNLPRDMTESPGSSDRVPKLPLIDATGRRVLSLKPGPNDVSSLAPGVYFVLTPTAAGRVVTRTTILK